MICAQCGQQTSESNTCDHCQQSPLLDGRYRLDNIIGQGGTGVTYRARYVGDGNVVCVKELAFNRMASFDVEKMFEREAKVLRQLAHPAIPGYIDFFSDGQGKSLSLYLVQEYVDGHTLEAEMDSTRYTEREVLEILDEVAKILEYLGELRPPVIHRDIKPSNILRRSDDRRLMLVDFGSVKATPNADGKTIAGTAGFMAPEQAWGTATVQTDLYGLGVLGVVLLTQCEPYQLLDDDQNLAWQQSVEARPATCTLLEALLQRNPEHRPTDAEAARQLIADAIDGLDARQSAHRPVARPPRAKAAATAAEVFKEAVTRETHQAIERVVATKAGPRKSRAQIFALLVALIIPTAVGAWAMLAPRPSAPGPTVVTTQPGPAPVSAPSTPVKAVTPSAPAKPAKPAKPAPPTCPGGKCQPYTVPFKDGLKFGMRIDQATAAMPALKNAKRSRPPFVGLRASDDPDVRAEAAGSRLVAETKTAGEDSTCRLDFMGDAKLAALDCRLAPLNLRQWHDAVDRVRDALIKRYGKPTDHTRGIYVHGFGAHQESNTWKWIGDDAEIHLDTRFHDHKSELQVRQYTHGYAGKVHRDLKMLLERQKERRQQKDDAPL